MLFGKAVDKPIFLAIFITSFSNHFLRCVFGRPSSTTTSVLAVERERERARQRKKEIWRERERERKKESEGER